MIAEPTLRSWKEFMRESKGLLRPIENDKHYDKVAGLLDELLDEGRSRRSKELESLTEYVTHLVSSYDEKHVRLPEAEGKDVLAFLMQERGLKQTDLSGLIPQAVLSQLLNGKRAFSARHAKVLGGYFKVSPAVFL
jgi:HTH-type transcriptional regulator / antitoxin HigA